MSANASISEGGKGYPFGPVKCLMVEGGDGEFYPWYPEADRALDSLSVTQNGIYRASDRGVHGWNRMSVNVAQSDRVMGRDPETGDEKTVTADPETGELVETVVPVEIRIETPPTFTGPYGDGAYIDFTGLTVAAYGANGDKMQDVPFNELIFPVTVTDASKAEKGDGEYDVTGLGLNEPVYLCPVLPGDVYSTYTAPYTVVKVVTGGVLAMVMSRGEDQSQLCFVSRLPGCSVYVERENGRYPSTIMLASVGAIDDKQFYYSPTPVANPSIGWPWSVSAGQPMRIEQAAGIALLGGHPKNGGQSIPVQWRCPDSYALLETSFKVEVVDISPNNNAGN